MVLRIKCWAFSDEIQLIFLMEDTFNEAYSESKEERRRVNMEIHSSAKRPLKCKTLYSSQQCTQKRFTGGFLEGNMGQKCFGLGKGWVGSTSVGYKLRGSMLQSEKTTTLAMFIGKNGLKTLNNLYGISKITPYHRPSKIWKYNGKFIVLLF